MNDAVEAAAKQGHTHTHSSEPSKLMAKSDLGSGGFLYTLGPTQKVVTLGFGIEKKCKEGCSRRKTRCYFGQLRCQGVRSKEAQGRNPSLKIAPQSRDSAFNSQLSRDE